MTKDDERIKDPRSTYRKRARSVLLKLVASGERQYKCVSCGHIPSIPWDVPSRGGDILDVNHINKNWRDCDPVNLEFLCRINNCHSAKDRQTAKGVSAIKDEYGYGI